VKFKCSDLRPGDRVVWGAKKRLEVIVMSVDHERRCWTHLCVVDDHHTSNQDVFHTTPPSSVESWGTEWVNAEIVSRSS
jgi:hypothetical protein